jgi:hypothetical protein
VWPFLGLYALFLLWEDRTRLAWVAGGLAVLPLLWLLPELWGSGNLWRAAERANIPNADSPAFADRPSIAEMEIWLALVTPPTWIGVGAAAVLGVRRAAGAGVRAVGGIAVVAIAWLALVAAMTEAGYSGNARYLAAPTALVYVVSGVGFAWLAARLLVTARGAGGRLLPAAWLATLALVAVVAGGSAAWAQARMPYMLRDTRYQAHVAHGLDDAIAKAGGREALLGCGRPFTNDFLVPLVAWTMHLHLDQVVVVREGSSVMLRARQSLADRADPPADALANAPNRRVAADTGLWRIETACGS